MRRVFLYLLIIIAFFFGCESEKNNELNNELEKRKNQVPNINNQNQESPQKIKVMTEFTSEQAKIKDLVIRLIYRNLEATHAEDVDAVMETIDPDGPQTTSTLEGMAYVFKNYDMVFEIEDLQFVSITSEEAKVLYQQTTRAAKGTGFVNTRSVGIHTIKKSEDGKWRIFQTDYISSKPIK